MLYSTNTKRHPASQEPIRAILTTCSECGLCSEDCAFLRKYGTPKEIVRGIDVTDKKALTRAFECNLCGLCSEVCPEKIDLKGLFWEMRRDAVERGIGDFAEHAPLLSYERLGTSRRFTLYRLPAGCTAVFFPGCGLSGTRPEAVRQVFARLRDADPAIGIVFDCCMKPSHGLGRERYAKAMFSEMRDYLNLHGVREVLVACPNCHDMFGTYGRGLRVKTIYEALAAQVSPGKKTHITVTVHDPCVLREVESVQQAVRKLLLREGLTVEEMPHRGKTTLCCGQGGGVNLYDPGLSQNWGNMRRQEANGRRIITYCAGCVQALQAHTPSSHILDVLFDPQKNLAGKNNGSAAPFTYLNRLKLKRDFQRMEGFSVTRERTFLPEQSQGKKRPWKLIFFLAFLVSGIAAIHLSGATRYLEQDKLSTLIVGYGALAPAIYIFIYTLAPVLFLPGLPITIVGGVLFGPVWGVAYTIIGATIGATLAFLVARYLARDWVAGKLTSPQWQKLDSEVERHGWKVVAFTRLIPAFPFNLLNYAFGLTRISLLHYVAATFIFMLPACIAFIVFSSSLLDLIRGNVSPAALIGIALIVAVSLIPLFYRRFKAKQIAQG